uniref:Uncharacterized protein n=1 Tax=OCS116 cluster bacterium TaxID=2030921 RepID=A0A2A4Z7A0_9PROT
MLASCASTRINNNEPVELPEVLAEPCPAHEFEAGKLMPQVANLYSKYVLCGKKVEALQRIIKPN